MVDITEMVVGKYLDAYKGLIVSEPVDNDSVTVSFPFHYSGDHRIELTITAVSGGQFIISDMARTVGELREFGLRIGATIRKRIEGISTGISFLASRRLRGYTCLPPVWPSAHNIFPQMVPLAPFRPSGVLKTNALPASGSVFSDTAACRGSLRINFSAAKAELPRGHWQPSNPPHHRRKQPPCQMALRQQ